MSRRHETTVEHEIPFRDVDLARVAWHGHYYGYFELARTRLLRERKLDVPDLIIPVPLHRWRLARRGFNQALEIALPVAAGLGLPLRPDICRRIRHTREQTALTGVARYQNMRDAFRATTGLSGRHIAIVDDVVTTGSTVAATARALQSAGASKIQVWSVARTHREMDSGSEKGVIKRNTGE